MQSSITTKLSFIFLALILLVSTVHPQDSGIRQRETNPDYELGDWISYSVARFVTSIAVGHQYVYFGTAHSGITRYDQFQHRWEYPWTTSNGLADNEVLTVAYDFDTGFLWCATHTAISYYQPTAQRWTNFFKDEFGLPRSDEIESIGVTPNNLLFETRGGRLFEANKFGGVILVANNTGGNFISRDKIRWYGKRAKRRREFPHFFMNNGYLFDPRGFVEDFDFRTAEVVASVEDDWGNLWIGTWGLGAGRGDVRSLQLEMLNFGLTNSVINSMTFHDQVLWIGGIKNFQNNRGSITAWDLDRQIWRYFEQRNIGGLRSDRIHSIIPDGDYIWFATGHGLSRYFSKERTWKNYDNFDGLSDNQVFDVAVNDSAIWVATANGIDYIPKKHLAQKDSLQFKQVNPGNLTLVEVYDLEMMENLLWAASNQGIYVYDVSKKHGGYSVDVGGPVDRIINSISRYKNEIWFGSNSGIDVYDIEKKKWLGVPEGRFFPNTVVTRVLASKKAVWAATRQGVKKFNRKAKSWRDFTVEDGLIDNRVNALLLDGDYIWFGTDRGITQFFWNDPSRVD
ncbi:hypothetical protein GWO43_11470 [candidate division KSB1 bacterium]|nr:hypothetical protein [candidate division KSB1 bacterium]NIR70642.1 hypothetical protein [candidate division KSB1 bacterium]NIS24572.1 hypothetical protein [candidate division KSB1 bacterium]NIT71485.1 hypothetical protein [candidate division KSB1 bacterium]NIU25181.1 hypothetical protein [candidate division KSB1 bacterium]